MPMIDVYVTAGTFPDKHQLATDLAVAVMTIEQVPDIPMFRQNTAASIHELPPRDLSTTTAKATTCGERPASIEDVAACHNVEHPFGCHGLLLPRCSCGKAARRAPRCWPPTSKAGSGAS